ncbi:unnamed protein product [Symbiodinium necroappetens]|uniref:Uncharacterized protein n=1 Tax=Symbiodinium necroappetens TaxID=1628268 RepID=A0A812QK73_9DINO|nr:unnamed protein product [Symbiodinium necroappetens]
MEQKGRKKDKTETAFDRLDAIIQASRVMPTIILFDAVWHLTFAWLEQVSKDACAYLKSTYFDQMKRASLQGQFWCGEPVWNSNSCWFAGFWAGVTGTYPGSGSGTQPLESFHAYWQDAVRSSVRSDPRAIFARMEKLFHDDWAKKFEWEESRVFQTWPQYPAQELLNGQALRTAGRSPAVDFYTERGRKLCGQCNHYKMYWRTDATTTDASGKDGTTVFYVMRCSKVGDVLPAQATITKETAERVVGLIAKDGAALKNQLLQAGILKSENGQESLELPALQFYLNKHCCVMKGHLPDSCWPRLRRRLQTAFPSVVCTCLEFLLHGDCEHVAFIKALEGEGNVDLRNIPVVRTAGRKRKADNADIAPEAKSSKQKRRSHK